MKFNRIAKDVLAKRYLQPKEKPNDMFRRVARFLTVHNPAEEELFYEYQKRGIFLPNSPTLMNAGTQRKNLSACFVLPVQDSMESIFTAVKNTALIHREGGGTGFNFSNIRARGSRVKGTNGVASGVISFMKVFDLTTEVVKQGGVRRGANIGILDWDHPEIKDFIEAKKNGLFSNFNISVAATDEFMKMGRDSYLFEKIVENAYKCGDPGLIFLDTINRKSKHYIDACNPCGELPLTPYESCNLGSINLLSFFNGDDFDFEGFKEAIEVGIIFLNRVIDNNEFPVTAIKYTTDLFRRIGLGVMGYADLLELLNIEYGSEDALNFTKKLARTLSNHSRAYSDEQGYNNTTVNAIAPTGTLSLLLNISSGIEPLYTQDLKGNYIRFAMEKEYVVKHPIKHKKTALMITPEEHVKTTATWQKYIDNGVSKTVNMKQSATKEEIKTVYEMAWKLGCKGITVFRPGKKQVIQKCSGDECSL
jgi:ribonucleoside-diphosphate reductase alpha chain